MIVNKSISEIINGYRVKQFSPVEVFREFVNQIKTINPKLNAFITINEDLGLQQAIRSEKKLMAGDDLGILEGIPI